MSRLVYLLLFVWGSTFLQLAQARVYHVNQSNSKSLADGSLEHPFRTLDALQSVCLQPGDSIVLSSNQVLKGTIHLAGMKAMSDRPVVVTSDGERKAEIYSEEASAIILDDCAHIHINNVVVRGKGRKDGNKGSGIEINDSRYIKIDSVEASGYLMNGIGVIGGGDIRITHAYVHDNGYNGIEVTSRQNDKSVHNIYIGYCVAENNPGCPIILDNHSGSGILVGHATNALVEYCEAMENGWDMPRPGNGPVGIWGYECDRLTIQYCYSHDNRTSSDGLDGGGFDFDGGITNSLMQYNLSMNNEGAGYGLFQYAGATEWNNNVIRYNISMNDGIKNSHAGIYVWCDPYNKDIPLRDTRVHDNLIVNSKHSISFNTGYSANLEFVKNKFLLTAAGVEYLQGDETMKLPSYRGNCFWSQRAEKDRTTQPKVVLDPEAVYEKIGYTLLAGVDIHRIKEIVLDMISNKD